MLDPWEGRLLQLQPCLGDARAEHFLFIADELTGIVDFDAVQAQHVAGDLARLLGTFAGDSAELWQAGLRAYRAIRPLPAEAERLAHVLDQAGTVLSLATWLDRLDSGELTGPGRERGEQRLASLVRRVEEWLPGSRPG